MSHGLFFFSFYFPFAQHAENICHVSFTGDFVFRVVSYYLSKRYHVMGQEGERGGNEDRRKSLNPVLVLYGSIVL